MSQNGRSMWPARTIDPNAYLNFSTPILRKNTKNQYRIEQLSLGICCLETIRLDWQTKLTLKNDFRRGFFIAQFSPKVTYVRGLMVASVQILSLRCC